MTFIYQYRTPDNTQHQGVVKAATKESAYSALKERGIKPSRVEEAPGFFNKLFGKGKRWIAIGILAALCVILAIMLGRGLRPVPRSTALDSAIDSTVRRQVIGDAAVIEQGLRSGWSEVFSDEGERFLASFAVPGVPAAQRNTTEAEIRAALTRKVAAAAADSIEHRQIKAMVEGMKHELREFLADGGTIPEYGKLLVQRQEQEIGYYNRAKAEIEAAHAAGRSEHAVTELWSKRNASLRRMGIKLIALPE